LSSDSPLWIVPLRLVLISVSSSGLFSRQTFRIEYCIYFSILCFPPITSYKMRTTQ
jgi:hypothetical protein